VRLFVAAPISAAVARSLWEDLAILRRRFPAARWVMPDKFHFTLKFMGETDERQIAGISQALIQAAHPKAVFSVDLEGMGVFQTGKGSVLWVGVGRGKSELVSLAESVDAALQPLKFVVGDRPYVPHLTLARFQDSSPRLSAGPESNPKGSLAVDRILLMQSVLKTRRGGP